MLKHLSRKVKQAYLQLPKINGSTTSGCRHGHGGRTATAPPGPAPRSVRRLHRPSAPAARPAPGSAHLRSTGGIAIAGAAAAAAARPRPGLPAPRRRPPGVHHAAAAAAAAPAPSSLPSFLSFLPSCRPPFRGPRRGKGPAGPARSAPRRARTRGSGGRGHLEKQKMLH